MLHGQHTTCLELTLTCGLPDTGSSGLFSTMFSCEAFRSVDIVVSTLTYTAVSQCYVDCHTSPQFRWCDPPASPLPFRPWQADEVQSSEAEDVIMWLSQKQNCDTWSSELIHCCRRSACIVGMVVDSCQTTSLLPAMQATFICTSWDQSFDLSQWTLPKLLSRLSFHHALTIATPCSVV